MPAVFAPERQKTRRDTHAELFAEIGLAIQKGVAQINGAAPAKVTKIPEKLSVRNCVSSAAQIASNGTDLIYNLLGGLSPANLKGTRVIQSIGPPRALMPRDRVMR
jgi:hypothetical protein